MHQKLWKIHICDALRDLVAFVQFKKRKKSPMEECYFKAPPTFFKLYKCYQIAQPTTYAVRIGLLNPYVLLKSCVIL